MKALPATPELLAVAERVVWFKTPALGGHPKPAIGGHLKTGQRDS
jgi:hypothetical protein